MGCGGGGGQGQGLETVFGYPWSLKATLAVTTLVCGGLAQSTQWSWCYEEDEVT